MRKKSVNLIECFCCFRIEETNINYEKTQKRRRSVITALFLKRFFFPLRVMTFISLVTRGRKINILPVL